MKSPVVSFLMIILFSATVPAQEKELNIIFDVTYVSRFIDKGFDCYRNNHSGIQPSLDLDLYNTGFGINVQWFRANSDGFENDEKLDYRLYYYNSLFEGEACAMEYKISWIYHNFTDSPKKVANSQEIEVEFEWPRICPLGIVPRYIVASEWPAGSNYENHNEGGWVHLFGIGHDLSMPGLLENSVEQIVHLSADIVYNDGTGANCNARANTGVDHDWSHAVFGISTDFEISENLTFTPGIYYQVSMDDSVNNSDEYWISSGLTYKF
ncbi:MAG: hypothetical protein RQ760_05225 [Sedimentisphaerales bacterium]|nr:hypothetical protein [Sedimentisphaerales bacterium]